ncbi:hypothetical protein EYF80_001336 [Liparis tanakae]|uniref:Uncharacterized protein n=1 Tax=Liparis tanakae TaxID=230148 RepID=A0A4Z2JFH4_9TELE|nr:hypothetical protein EYF80_001336 [Liparis tanakae]
MGAAEGLLRGHVTSRQQGLQLPGRRSTMSRHQEAERQRIKMSPKRSIHPNQAGKQRQGSGVMSADAPMLLSC